MFSRTQALALVVGAANLALGVMQVFPGSAAQHCLQALVGALGIVLARRHWTARMFGMILLFGFGGALVWHLRHAGELGSWLPLRMAVSGIVITLVPASGRRLLGDRETRRTDE
ncbi:hypothetical protein [Qaidamihabitans albus]|uniref:hypothetical protein n=1 Tax=Qaidamihabitans albus TaxID=2795733 RepID=UPI0018F17ADA|nr:hypothetical protein [Qaidamihabitans albus]